MSPPASPSMRTRVLARLWDVVLFAMAILWTVVGLMNVPGTENSDGTTDLGLALWLVAIAMWVSIFVRREYPAITLGAGLLLALIGMEYLLLLIGVYHAALTWRPPARTWLAWGTLGVVALFWVREALTDWGDLMAYTDNATPANRLFISALIAIISLAFTAGLVMVTRHKRQAQGERIRADLEHSHAARLGEELSRQSERTEIAREIHDGLTNRLALVSMMSGNLKRAVHANDPQAASLALDVQTQARHALTDLRALIGDLRTEPSAPAARETSMRSLGDLVTATRAAGTKLDAMVILDSAHTVHPELDAAVFRLVQEALTNAVKHAPGQTVSLYLDAGPRSGVRIRVANPLPRLDLNTSMTGMRPGSGLTGMRERVVALHGTTWTGEHEGEFIVDITVPWLMADAAFNDSSRELTS